MVKLRRLKYKIKEYFRNLAWKRRVKKLDKEVYDKLYVFKVEDFEMLTLDKYKKLEKTYLQILKYYCKHWLKIDYKTTLKILFGLNDFNWKRLHQTDEQRKESYIEFLDTFRYEYSYISDRYSYTRMLRAHWLWLVFSMKFFDHYNEINGYEWRDEGHIEDYEWFDNVMKGKGN